MKYIDKIVKVIHYLLIVFLILLVPLFFLNKIFGNYINIGYYDILWKTIPVSIFIYLYNLFRKKTKPEITDYLIYLLIILNIITCKYAIDSNVSIYGNDERHEGFLSFLAYYSVFLSCKGLGSKKAIKNLMSGFIVVGIFQFIYCVFQIYFKDLLLPSMVYWFSSNMANGFINNPNFMGSLIILFLGFSIMMYLANDKGIIWYYLLSVIFYINIIFSQSTGPFLGAVFMVIFALIFLFIKRKLKIFRYLILVGTFIFTYFIIDYSYRHIESINQNIAHQAYTINYDLKQLYRAITGDMVLYDIPVDDPNYDWSSIPVDNEDNLNGLGSGRIMIWRNTLKLIPDYYLHGCGFDSFGLVYQWHDRSVYYDKAHNDYLEILITRGIFTLITYLIFLLVLFIKGIKSSNPLVWSFLLSIIGYAIQDFTNISVVNVTPYFYMLCGFLMATINLEKSDNLKNDYS